MKQIAPFVLALVLFVAGCDRFEKVQKIEEYNVPTEVILTNWTIYNIIDQNQKKVDSFFAGTIGISKLLHVGRSYKQGVDYLDLRKTNDTKKDTNKCCYVISTKVKCDNDLSAVLMLGCVGNCRIWVNKELLTYSPNNPVFNKYSDYYRIRLKKGLNEIFITACFNGFEKSHKIICGIGNESFALENHHNLYWNNFLYSCILKQKDSLIIKFPVLNDTICSVNISKYDYSISYKNKVSLLVGNGIALTYFKNGVYDCTLSFKNRVYKQSFLIGNYDSLFNAITGYFVNYKVDSNYRTNVEPLIERYRYLNTYTSHRGQRRAYYSIEVSTDKISWANVFNGFSTFYNLQAGVHALSSIKARYIKINCYGNSFHEWNAISEINIYGSEKPEKNDVHQLIIREISTSSFEGTNYSSNVYDNNLNTTWESKGNDQWILLDLDTISYLSNIEIAWKRDTGTDERVLNWQRSMAFDIYELNAIRESLKTNKSPYNDKPGRHILGYYSASDSSVLNYIVQAPDVISTSRKYPLILHILPRFETPAHILKSYLLSDTKDLDRSQLEINKTGAIDIWTFARSDEAYIYPTNVVEYLNVLRDVNKYYAIDTNRIYLFGTCSGTIKAIQFAELYPAKVAGIASCPITYNVENEFRVNERLSNLQNIPIFIVHAREDELTPIRGLFDFLNLGKQHSLKINYTILENTSRAFYTSEQYFKLYSKLLACKNRLPDSINFSTYQRKYSGFDWIDIKRIKDGSLASMCVQISEKKIALTSKNIEELSITTSALLVNNNESRSLFVNNKFIGFPDRSLKTFQISIDNNSKNSDNGLGKNKVIEGPINHAFASNFMLVKGTSGNHEASIKNDKLVLAFQKYWKKYNYSGCSYKLDVNLNKEDVNSRNLILFGNDVTNKYISDIKYGLPLNTGIENIFTKAKQFGQYGIVYVYPNPQNANRYVVIVDIPDGIDLDQGVFKIITNNNFDYCIFNKNADETNNLIQTGFFRSNWAL